MEEQQRVLTERHDVLAERRDVFTAEQEPDFIQNFIHKKVKVGRGGPEAKSGYLLGFFSDYFILWTDEKEIVYYQSAHTRSITLDSTNTQRIKEDQGLDTLTYVHEDSFVETIKALKHNMVQINRGGPDCLTGVIVEVNDNYFTISVEKEVIFVFTQHVKSISLAPKENKNKDSK
jgi:spore coat protein B